MKDMKTTLKKEFSPHVIHVSPVSFLLLPHQRRTRLVRSRIVETDGGTTGGGELLTDGSAGVERAVAIGAEVAEVKIFHEIGDHFGGHFRRRIVGKMAVA